MTERRDGHSAMVFDKATGTIKTIDLYPETAVRDEWCAEYVKARDALAASRQECEALRKALCHTLSYCDAAVHATTQYHDEREALYRTALSLPEPTGEQHD